MMCSGALIPLDGCCSPSCVSLSRTKTRVSQALVRVCVCVCSLSNDLRDCVCAHGVYLRLFVLCEGEDDSGLKSLAVWISLASSRCGESSTSPRCDESSAPSRPRPSTSS